MRTRLAPRASFRTRTSNATLLLAACVCVALGCGGYDEFGTARPDGGSLSVDAAPTGSDATTPTPDTSVPQRDSGRTIEGRYHPAGYADVGVHGPDSNLQVEDCRDCHGADLRGGSWRDRAVPSCDSCHDAADPAWRTNCVFCHGGDETTGGAPPRGLDSRTTVLAFGAHTVHVSRTNHPAYDCSECHTVPTDALSPEHAFDSTPGRVELNFGGLNAAGSYDGNSCTNSYCHGNGKGNNGAVMRGDLPLDCTGCHAQSGATGLGGQHRRHSGEKCSDCHPQVVDTSNRVIGPDLHVNGSVEWSVSEAGVSLTAGTCNGLCHGKFHFGKSW